MKRILILISALLLFSTVGLSQEAKGKPKAKGQQTSADTGSVKETIAKMENELRQSSLKGDSSAAEKHLAHDYHTISGVSGQSYDKKQVIDRMKSGATKWSEINVSNEDVTTYHPNVAISHGVADVKMTVDGKDASGKYHFARTWLKRNGKWQAVWFQTTKMQ